jgi:hypothetical protein
VVAPTEYRSDGDSALPALGESEPDAAGCPVGTPPLKALKPRTSRILGGALNFELAASATAERVSEFRLTAGLL